MSQMQAIVLTRYGAPDQLQLQQVDRPTPGPNDVLVQVVASTVTAADTMMRRADPFISRFFLGFYRPRRSIMGTGFAGRVVAVGAAVREFQPGDAVFGETGTNFGANAEYLCLPATAVILPKPESLSFAAAATLTDGPLTSYNFLKQLGRIQPGQRVLINGAGGSLGSAAVQLANYYGAHVTGVCSTGKVELVRQLGANRVIDYTTTDFTQEGTTYDLIYDTVGKLSYSSSRHSLTPWGRFLSPVLGLGLLWQVIRTSFGGGRKAIFSATGLLDAAQLRTFLTDLLAIVAEARLQPLIDKRFPLERTAEAHRYVDTGHKTGNVVLMVL